jgi:hypothetical protein
MTSQEALAMTPSNFQALVNKGFPIILMGWSEPITFDLPTLFGLIDFQADVCCIGQSRHLSLSLLLLLLNLYLDSDVILLGDEHPVMSMPAHDAAHEMCEWQTSRPLIVTRVPHAAGVYQPIERYALEPFLRSDPHVHYRLLNTHDVALADFPLKDRDVHVRNWRGPMLSTAGSIHPPHQCPNGMGISLYCASGYILFFVPILQDDQHVIVNFDDIEEPLALGFEYLYEAPNRFTTFTLSPGQTV